MTEKWLEQEKESLSERYAEQVRRLQEDMADKSLSQIRGGRTLIYKVLRKIRVQGKLNTFMKPKKHGKRKMKC